MADKSSSEDKKRPIIVKKVKKVVGGGHHGGAWKVAYADFVTAMMAFFLLLWLLNVSTQEQLNGIADYFRPTLASVSQSGAGGVMGGISAVTDGAMRTELVNDPTDSTPTALVDIDDEETEEPETEEQNKKITRNEFERLKAEEEQKTFEEARQELMSAIQNDAQLKELAKNLIIDMTPEGLRIQIVDQQGKSMFPLGSAKMYDETYLLISKVTQVITKLPNHLSINGHTDSLPYGTNATYNNWDLSSERANASRRALVASGLAEKRIANVSGKAEIDPLFPQDTTNPQNRRISIILLRQHKAPPATQPPNVDQLRATSGNPNYNQPFRARP
jgi:chemotaxis protein MotB